MGAAHIPTKDNRAKVAALASFGITQSNICKYIGVSPMTLTKYYHDELDTAAIDKTVAVANALFHNATERNNVTAQIFWLKTRARWREDNPDETQGAIGKIEIEVIKGKEAKLN